MFWSGWMHAPPGLWGGSAVAVVTAPKLAIRPAAAATNDFFTRRPPCRDSRNRGTGHVRLPSPRGRSRTPHSTLGPGASGGNGCPDAPRGEVEEGTWESVAVRSRHLRRPSAQPPVSNLTG